MSENIVLLQPKPKIEGILAGKFEKWRANRRVSRQYTSIDMAQIQLSYYHDHKARQMVRWQRFPQRYGLIERRFIIGFLEFFYSYLKSIT